MSFPFTINKFLPINIKNTDAITGTYSGVSILNNGKTELVGDTVINGKVSIGKAPSAYEMDISGNANVSGGVYANALTVTGGITASGTQTITFGSNAPTMSGANISAGTIGQTQVSNGYLNLSSVQSVSGIKTFVDPPVLSGSSITAGTIGQTQVLNGYLNLSTAQDISGAKTFTESPLVPTVSPLGDYSNKVVNTQYLADTLYAFQIQDAYFQYPLPAPIGFIASNTIHNYLSTSTTSIKMPNETLLPYVGFRYIIYTERQWSSLPSSVPITTITGSTFVFNGQIVSSITMDVNNSFLEIICINITGSGVCWSVIRKDPNSLLSSSNTFTNTNTYSVSPVVPTVTPDTDNSTKVASTAFVNNYYNNRLTTTNTWTNTNTFSSSPIIKSQFVRSSLYATGTTLNISSGTLQPVYCLLPTGNMTITLPTASATFDGVVILFYRVGGTNTLTVNSASSNIYNYSLTFTNSILLARQTIRQIICQQNNGVYAWYYADGDELLYSSNNWYGANAYIVNPTFTLAQLVRVGALTDGNTAVGNLAQQSLQAGALNNFNFGSRSGQLLTTGGYNHCFGNETLQTATTAQHNMCIGYGSLAFTSGSFNTAIGSFAMVGNNGSENLAFGYNSGRVLNGSYNVNIGNYASWTAGASNTNNVVIGYNAQTFTNQIQNVLIGSNSSNGSNAGNNNNVLIGYGCTNSGAFTNSVCIGVGSVINASNRINLGSSTQETFCNGGVTIPSTKNLSLQGCLLSATQTYNTNNSVLSLTGAKMVYVTASSVTQLYLPLPTAADVGKIFTISKSGGATWSLALRRNVGTTFTIDYGGLATNEVYSMEVSEFTVDIMVMSSATSGVCYNVLYTTPTVFRNPIVYSSAFFLPPQSVIPGTRSAINTIVIGQDALIGVTSGTHANSNTVIGASAGKVISGNPSALTIIGREALGQSTGISDTVTALGYRSGWNLTSSASTRCLFLGDNCGVSSPTTAYTQSSCVGSNSVITASNQVVLGTASETVFVPGTLQVDNNYIASASPTLITGNTTLSGAVYQFYSVSLDAGNVTITLPTASADYLGCSITFRRVGSNSSNQIFASANNIIQADAFTTTDIIMAFSKYRSTITCMLLDATPSYAWFHYIFIN